MEWLCDQFYGVFLGLSVSSTHSLGHRANLHGKCTFTAKPLPALMWRGSPAEGTALPKQLLRRAFSRKFQCLLLQGNMLC
eukprot:6489784-Amphidinium_carterae.2